MTGIWEFPELDALRFFFIEGIEQAMEVVEQRLREEDQDDRAIFIGQITLERIVITGEWGQGTAEIDEDRIESIVFFGTEAEQEPHLIPGFDTATRTILQEFMSMIEEDIITPPDPSFEWFEGLSPPSPVPISRFDDQINLALGAAAGNRVFDITRLEGIQLTEDEERRSVPLQELPGFGEEPEEEPEALPEPEEEIEEEEFPFEPVEEGPEIPRPEPTTRAQLFPVLETFRLDDDTLSIPAGNEERKVPDRELYDFELRMGLPPDTLGNLEGFGPGDTLENGIGWSMFLGRFGTLEPAATYPRTSSYVRNRLLFEGIAYTLEIYRDLVVYGGFISAFYDMNLKPGHYRSFRQFMFRLEQIEERGGPELVIPLTQQAAAARGLETLPDHPTIEGEKAPWLERRQYYDINEDNIDHEAWDNPVEFLQNLPIPQEQ